MTATLDVPTASVDTRRFLGWWLGIVAGHFAFWALIMSRGWLYWDDFILQGQAARLGLSSELLLNNHDGHVMPLSYLAVWAVEHLGGLNYAGVALTMLVGEIIFVGAAVLAMRELLGTGVPGLVGAAFLLLSPIVFPGLTWWAAALTVVPFMSCALLCTFTLLRYYRRGSQGALVSTFVLVAVALGFFEKSLLIVVWLFLLTVLVQPSSGFFASVRTALSQHWRIWTAWAVFLGVYFLAFAQVAQGRTRLPTGPGQVIELVLRAVFRVIAPGLAGGPIRWSAVDFSASYADPGPLMIAAGCVVCGTLIWFGTRSPGIARKAWVGAGLYLLADLATFAVGRLGADGDPAVVQGCRYVASSLLPISVAIGATFAEHRDLVHRRRVALGVAGGFITFLATLSVVTYAAVWWDNPAQKWVGNARADLAATDQQVPLLDQDVPDFLVLPVVHPYNQVSWFLAPLDRQPGISTSTPRLQLIDNRGRLVDARVDGARSLPAPNGCYRVPAGGTVSIPLEHALIAWIHTVELHYDAPRAGVIEVSIGSGEPVAAPVTAGQNTVYVRAEGGESSITVGSPQTSMCVTSATVGRVVPADLLYGGDQDISDKLGKAGDSAQQ